MDLVCPAGSLPALKAAVDNGTDCVYLGFRDDTNARNFSGLNFDPAATREGQPFLTLNGIQTQSARTCNLIRELDELLQLGVDVLRISPQSADTFTIIELFRQCHERVLAPDLAAQRMDSLMPAVPCNGYWHGRPGFEQVASSVAA